MTIDPTMIEVLESDTGKYVLYFDGEQVGMVEWDVPIMGAMDTYYYRISHNFGRPFHIEFDCRVPKAFESTLLYELKKRLGLPSEYVCEVFETRPNGLRAFNYRYTRRLPT